MAILTRVILPWGGLLRKRPLPAPDGRNTIESVNRSFPLALALALMSCARPGPSWPTKGFSIALPPALDLSAYRLACVRASSCLENAVAISQCTTVASRKLSAPGSLGQLPMTKDQVTCINQGEGRCADIAGCLHTSVHAAACNVVKPLQCQGAALEICLPAVQVLARRACSDGATCGPCEQHGYCCSDEPARGYEYPHCEGSQLIGETSHQLIYDCADFGQFCRNWPPESRIVSTCHGTGRICGPNHASYCVGDQYVRCVSGHEWAVYCPSLDGRQCTEQNGKADCTVLKPQCRPEHEECNGDQITYCDDGIRRTASCSALGFTKCGRKGARVACQ